MSVVCSKKSLNETFVSYSREGRGLRSQQFQTYKFVGCVHRILAKILANILKEVLGKVISQLYNAIVQERKILGSVPITKICVDSRVVKHPWNFVSFFLGYT